MTYSFENGVLSLSTFSYSLRADSERIAVTVGGTEFVRLDVRSGLNLCGEGAETLPDEEGAVLSFRVDSADRDSVTLVWESASSLWEKKEYILICRSENAEYKVRVTGKGAVDSVNYFSGSMTEPCHGSSYDFCKCYAPIVGLGAHERYTFFPNENFSRFSYLMVPPMFFYTFRAEEESARLTFGLVAKPGEHNFTQFNYRMNENRWGCLFWLWTDQSGHTKVDGQWETPSVFFFRSSDEKHAMRQYPELYFSRGYTTPANKDKKPRFWYGPIACGWLEQLAAAYAGEYGLCDGSRQYLYERMVERLEARDLHPQILIIDDKWQTAYGSPTEDKDKWPDLPGFVRRMREERGIHTLMWYKMWDSEGVPEEYCVWSDKDQRYLADPTNPGYIELLRQRLYHIISDDEGCIGADGLKIDFAFWQPVGRGAVSHSGKYGVELFLELVRLIHRTIKEIKPYAILNCSPCHPLFAPYCDQVRLHDYDYRQRDALGEMGRRAELFCAALGDPLVDTDGCGYNTRRDTMRYLTRAVEIGIPDTYCISDTPYLALSEEDWAEVAKVWRDYSDGIDRMLAE